MRVKHKALICAVAIAIAVVGGGDARVVSTAAGAPPRTGTLLPGSSLGGVRLGMSKADVLAVWGKRHGACKACPSQTWYFNYRPFQPQGTGVVFEHGRVAHAFTVWRPIGWKTPDGLFLGAKASDVARIYGSLDKRACTFYDALLIPGTRVTTIFYVFRDKVWGFGLMRPTASPCL